MRLNTFYHPSIKNTTLSNQSLLTRKYSVQHRLLFRPPTHLLAMGNAQTICLRGEQFGARYWWLESCLDFTESACQEVDGIWKGWQFNAYYCEDAKRYYESGDPMIHRQRRLEINSGRAALVEDYDLKEMLRKACDSAERDGCVGSVTVDVE